MMNYIEYNVGRLQSIRKLIYPIVQVLSVTINEILLFIEIRIQIDNKAYPI